MRPSTRSASTMILRFGKLDPTVAWMVTGPAARVRAPERHRLTLSATERELYGARIRTAEVIAELSSSHRLVLINMCKLAARGCCFASQEEIRKRSGLKASGPLGGSGSFSASAVSSYLKRSPPAALERETSCRTSWSDNLSGLIGRNVRSVSDKMSDRIKKKLKTNLTLRRVTACRGGRTNGRRCRSSSESSSLR